MQPAVAGPEGQALDGFVPRRRNHLRQGDPPDTGMVYQALLALKGKGAEDFLRTQILLPVLRHKYGIEEVHDWCGPYERGADVGCWVEGPCGRKELVGIVITVGHITKPICQKILNQAEQTLVSGHPTSRVGGTDEANAGRAWVVITDPWESWTEGARTLWNDRCVPQSILRDVERMEPSRLAETICDNDPAGDTRRKLLEKVGLWKPPSLTPVAPPDLRSVLSVLSSQPRSAALRATELGVTHWSTNDTPKAMEAVRGELQNPDVPFVAKRLLLGWLAGHRSTDSAVQSLVQEVIEDSVLARHFLAQMDEPDWLELAKPEFEKIAQDGPPMVRRALALTVARLCGNERQLALHFLRLLWATDEQPVGWACAEIISQLGLWPDVEDLLEPVSEQHAVGLSFMPFAVARAAEEQRVTGGFAAKWLATWTLSQMREDPVGGPHFRDSLRHAFGEILEEHPASVLPYAVELVEANCQMGKQLGDELYGLKDTDLRMHLQFRFGVRGSREEPAFVVLTALLQLAEAGTHVVDLGAEIEKLLESEYTAARAIGIKVCRANPKEFVPQCVVALTDWRNMVYPLGDATRPLVSAAYTLLAKTKQKQAKDVLLNLKSETEREGYEGVTRLYALKSIPEEHRTEEVEAEIEHLQERLGEREVPPEPEMQVTMGALDAETEKRVQEIPAEDIVEFLEEREREGIHEFDREDIARQIGERGKTDCQFAFTAAEQLGQTQSLPATYAEQFLWAMREAHTVEERMEAVWRLRRLDDPRVHGIAADIIERSAPDLSPTWLRRARRLLYEWATDPEPESETVDSGADLLQVGINSARGRVAEALLRIVGEHGLKPRSSDVLRALAGDKSPAVRACVLGKLGHLLPKCYDVSLDLFARATSHQDDRVLQYAIWCARYVKSADYRQYVAPVIRRAVASSDEQVARTGGLLAAWWVIGAPKAHPELEETLIDTQQSAVLRGAEEVFSAHVFSEDEEIAQASREWCLRLMKRGDSDFQHSIVMSLWTQDAIDLGSVSEILMQAAESDDTDTIRDLLHVLEKGVKRFPNEAATVLSKLWSRETSQQALKQLHIGELQHEVLEELLHNDECTVANRRLAWDIFDALLQAGDAWATSQFDEYVKIATIG